MVGVWFHFGVWVGAKAKQMSERGEICVDPPQTGSETTGPGLSSCACSVGRRRGEE